MNEGLEEVFMTSLGYHTEMAKEKLDSLGKKPVVLKQCYAVIQPFGKVRFFDACSHTTTVKILKDLKSE